MTDDELREALRWLTDVVYLNTLVDGVTVKEFLIRKWSDPSYKLTSEEVRLLEIILEQGVKDDQERSGGS